MSDSLYLLSKGLIKTEGAEIPRYVDIVRPDLSAQEDFDLTEDEVIEKIRSKM